MKRIFVFLTVIVMVALCLSSCQELTDVPDNQPTVVTGSYSVDGSYVVLYGKTTAKNSFFMISTDKTFADSVKLNSTNMGNDSVSGSEDILRPGKTYYYVLCATDGHSTVQGEVKSFSTPKKLAISAINLYDWGGKTKNPLDDEISVGLYFGNGDIYKNSYSNYNCHNVNGVWQLPYGIDIPTKDTHIYAYAPIGDTDSTLYLCPGTTDYIYGASNVLNANNTDAVIDMHHIMTKVVVDITAKTQQSKKLMKVYFSGDDYFIYHADFNVLTSQYINDKEGLYREEVRFFYNYPGITVPTDKPLEYSLFFVPQVDYQTAEFVLLWSDNTYSNVTFEKQKWDSNSVYTYSISVGDKVTGIVNVSPWVDYSLN
jgi:hypothetical protein